MQTRDLFYTSFNSIRRKKSRSLLTILGIVIGIGAVILMLSIGKGAEGLILSQVSDLGSDVIYIEPGSGEMDQHATSQVYGEKTLTLDDADALQAYGVFPEIAPMLFSEHIVQYQETESRSQVIGTNTMYTLVFPADVVSGRNMTEADVDSSAYVAVLGDQIKNDLFGDQDPVGKEIKIKNSRFEVIGVLEKQGTKFFQNLDAMIYVPVTTLQTRIMGVDYINFLAAKTTLPVELAKDEARMILREEHNIDNPENDLAKDDFFISTQEDAVQIVGTITIVLTLLLSSIAAISLVVGGIGIMNIMLVSVTERTKEIGLRKAVGATYREILWQFLLEAMMLTLAGGVVGVAGGIGTAFLVAVGVSTQLDGWAFVIPLDAVVYAVVVATAVGLIFGLYPARRAARLDPIEALRYE